MDNKKLDSSLDSTNYLLLNAIKLCDKYYNLIEKKLKSINEYRNDQSLNQLDNKTELKDLEIEFWNELKLVKDTNEPIVIQYIIGVYIKLQQMTIYCLNSNIKNDIYFLHGLNLSNRNELEFIYNLYIHLGDLNRYQKSIRLAKQFYLKARILIPQNGQSYNQLALIYSQDPIKSIYFYVRAYLAIEPSKIALNNLKFTIKHFLNINPIIKLIFGDTSIKLEKIKTENWLYLIIIAIFADNIGSIIENLFADIKYWFKIKAISIKSTIYEPKEVECDFNCTFGAFDLFLDYCIINQNTDTNQSNQQTTNGNQTSNLFSNNFNLIDYEKNLKEFKQLFNEYTTRLNLDCQFDPIALRHDFMLQGLNLLQKQHSQLIFTNKDSKYATNLNRLICRISLKINQVVSLIDKKIKQQKQSQKKIRNVALQSILNGNNN